MDVRRSAINLTEFHPVKSLILWRGFPYLFQTAILAGFLLIAWSGWNSFPPLEVPDKLFAKTNIVTLLIWGLWWPAMIWVAVLFGRVWCAVCPLELVANMAERISRGIGIRQRSLGRALRSGVAIVLLYAVLQMLVPGIHLHRNPAYTSIFMISLVVLAAIVGFAYKDRAFCRAFCPVGMLLNAYGRGGTIAVRSSSASVCSKCTGKDCLVTCTRNNLDGRSCPSLLNPPRLNSNKDCLVCGQCIKSCVPDNMQVLLRRPFCREDEREPSASVALTAFVMLASGFVTSELCAEWPPAQSIFLTLPHAFTALLDLGPFAGWIEGLWTLCVFPLLVWLLFGAIIMLLNRGRGIVDIWRTVALPMTVVVSAAHMSKAMAKFTSWVVYLPGTLDDPGGVRTATAIASRSQLAPRPLLDLHTAGLISLGLLILGLLLAVREARLANPQLYRRQLFPKLTFACIFGAIVAGWL